MIRLNVRETGDSNWTVSNEASNALVGAYDCSSDAFEAAQAFLLENRNVDPYGNIQVEDRRGFYIGAAQFKEGRPIPDVLQVWTGRLTR